MFVPVEFIIQQEETLFAFRELLKIFIFAIRLKFYN